MLIEFSVENYKSIKERQTLSMVAGNGRLETGFNTTPQLTEIAGIYGKNGSGKTKFVEAMEFFRGFIVNSHKLQPTEEIEGVVPFLFSKETQNKPSTFEAVFIHNGILFEYGFIVDSQQIHGEWLYATTQGKQRQTTKTWLNRDKQNFVSPAKKISNNWEKETGENQLFLSVAANRQSEDFKKPFSWLRNSFRILDNSLPRGFTMKQIQENGKKDAIMKMMAGLDASFDDIQIIEREYTEEDLPKDLPDEFKQHLAKDFIGQKKIEIFTLHEMEDGGNYPLPLADESEGTKKLFAFAAPILDVLENGYTLVVDELEKSLHPIALKGIISLFQNKETNPKNAQLIFTTHNTSVMNALDREQIWLLDKGAFGDTFFTALSEYNDKPDAPLEKRYLGGRYGALPNIGDIL